MSHTNRSLGAASLGAALALGAALWVAPFTAWARESCPPGMTRVDGGRFQRADGGPVDIATFCMDSTEVTAAAFALCVDEGACRDEGLQCSNAATYRAAGKEHHPVNCATWLDANGFCRDLGKRLPTEDEFEWAARGQRRGTTFPWGESAPAERACWDGEGNGVPRGERKGTCAVHSHPRGDGPGGIADLAGNVREWTSSEDGRMRIVRGGSWGDTEPSFLAASFRGMNSPDERLELTGFRCVCSPGAKVVDAAARAKKQAKIRAARARAAGPVDVTGVRIWR